MDMYMRAAVEEAKKGMREGGIPIGSVLVVDGKIVGRGHNRRVQQGSPILHAEMDAFESAGRLKASDYQRAILYSSLSPVTCVRGYLHYKIPHVVVGENHFIQGLSNCSNHAELTSRCLTIRNASR